MTWWQDGIITLLTGGLLVVFRIWLEINWEDK
ncbi:Trp-rich small protein [Staphylococcus pasteuri]